MYCSCPATLRLEQLDSSGNVTAQLDLMDEHNGFRVASLDVAFPTVRAVTAALPTRDGDYDTTRLMGPRTVTVTGSLVASTAGTRSAALAALAAWAVPGLRPRIVYSLDGEPPLTLGLRGSQLSAPASNIGVSAFSVSWEAPNPIASGLVDHQTDISPQLPVTGRVYNLTFNRVYPHTAASGIGTCFNAGTYPAWPVLDFYGPCTDPAVYWVTPPGGAVVFSGLTVAAGDFVAVDTYAQTALLNGQAGANRFYLLDFAKTVWAPLQPGTTTLQYRPSSFQGGSYLVVNWNDASI